MIQTVAGGHGLTDKPCCRSSGGPAVHALIDLIATLIAALAAAAFAQFGIELQPSQKQPEDREVRRTDQRDQAVRTDAVFVRTRQDC